MNHIIDTLREIFYYLGQYKARTFMTMFGLIWGTITVIVLLSFGVGVERQMSKNMHGMGDGIAILWPNRTSQPFKGYGRDRQIRFLEEDATLLKGEIKEIEYCSPEYGRWGVPIRVGDKINKTNVGGAIPEYGPMRNLWPESGGRWLNELDIRDRKRVAFIGNKIKDLLFGEKVDAVGKMIYIGDSPFIVIGVMREKTQPSSYTTRDQDRVVIPASTFSSYFGNRYINNIIYKPRDARDAKFIQQRIYEVLGKKYVFDPKDKEALSIWDTTEMDKFLFYFSLGMKIFLGLIGVITLTVGGIGLANIMYVVVQERTREIGIRRAVGARKKHILGQFILESFFIIGFSAIIGFVVAVLLLQVLSMLPIEEYVGKPVLNLPVAVISIFVLSMIGFFAGYFPSRKASRLVVVDCLRY
ncbi:MAG TPA: FtsX-like permease family protein [bacterium]|nr:FtsX-like permease family protein [bacterium]